MASNLQIDDDVFVCRSRIPQLEDQGKAFFQTKVLDRQNRSVKIQMPNGELSELISTKFVHHRVGVAIIEVGDIVSESTLLDPLAKTALQYSRLLLGDDDYVRLFKIRTYSELEHICGHQYFHAFEHIIIIGHGSKDAELCFAMEKVSVSRLIEAFNQNNPNPWNFIFLCCYLGRNAFAKPFSKAASCKSLVGPYNSVHGAVSAQFAQTYLIKALLEGETTTVAHRHGSESTPPKSEFRLWRDGVLLKKRSAQTAEESFQGE